MSDTMKHYVAGLLTYASDLTAFLAPNINSYKRFQAGSFAPTKAIWSTDNRTAGFRVVGHGPSLRSVHEIKDGVVDSHLIIPGGTSGIKGSDQTPPPPHTPPQAAPQAQPAQAKRKGFNFRLD